MKVRFHATAFARHAKCIGVKIQQSLGRALLTGGQKSKSRLLQLECFEEDTASWTQEMLERAGVERGRSNFVTSSTINKGLVSRIFVSSFPPNYPADSQQLSTNLVKQIC